MGEMIDLSKYPMLQRNSNINIDFLPLKLYDPKLKYENVIHPNLNGLTIVLFAW